VRFRINFPAGSPPPPPTRFFFTRRSTVSCCGANVAFFPPRNSPLFSCLCLPNALLPRNVFFFLIQRPAFLFAHTRISVPPCDQRAFSFPPLPFFLLVLRLPLDLLSRTLLTLWSMIADSSFGPCRVPQGPLRSFSPKANRFFPLKWRPPATLASRRPLPVDFVLLFFQGSFSHLYGCKRGVPLWVLPEGSTRFYFFPFPRGSIHQISE